MIDGGETTTGWSCTRRDGKQALSDSKHGLQAWNSAGSRKGMEMYTRSGGLERTIYRDWMHSHIRIASVRMIVFSHYHAVAHSRSRTGGPLKPGFGLSGAVRRLDKVPPPIFRLFPRAVFEALTCPPPAQRTELRTTPLKPNSGLSGPPVHPKFRVVCEIQGRDVTCCRLAGASAWALLCSCP
jgi:hypothetical protein